MAARRLPPLNALRAFESAGRHLSFAAAAKELNVTPAAVSHQIRTLEDNLQKRLFKREPNRLTLTTHGQRLLPGLIDAFYTIARAVGEVVEQPERAPLTVSVIPSLAGKWLIQRLPKFYALEPDIDVRIDATSNLADFNVDTDIDLSIRYGRGDYPGLLAEKVADGGVSPVCSPALLSAGARLDKPEDLQNFTLLHADATGRDTDPSWEEWLASAGADGVDAGRGPRFNYMIYAVQAAIEGHGIALASDPLVSDDIAANRLIRPFDRGPAEGLQFSYYLVAPRQDAQRPAVKAFWNWIKTEMQATENKDRQARHDVTEPTTAR